MVWMKISHACSRFLFVLHFLYCSININNRAKHHASTFIKLQQSTDDNIFSQRTSHEMSDPSLGTPKFSVHDSKHSNLHKKKHWESESRDFHFLSNFELESISKNNNENKNLMWKSKISWLIIIKSKIWWEL